MWPVFLFVDETNAPIIVNLIVWVLILTIATLVLRQFNRIKKPIGTILGLIPQLILSAVIFNTLVSYIAVLDIQDPFIKIPISFVPLICGIMPILTYFTQHKDEFFPSKEVVK